MIAELAKLGLPPSAGLHWRREVAEVSGPVTGAHAKGRYVTSVPAFVEPLGSLLLPQPVLPGAARPVPDLKIKACHPACLVLSRPAQKVLSGTQFLCERNPRKRRCRVATLRRRRLPFHRLLLYGCLVAKPQKRHLDPGMIFELEIFPECAVRDVDPVRQIRPPAELVASAVVALLEGSLRLRQAARQVAPHLALGRPVVVACIPLAAPRVAFRPTDSGLRA